MLRRRFLIHILTLGFIVLAPVVAWAQDAKIHYALGKPSNSLADKANPNPTDYFLEKPRFAISYNSKKGTPNWVSWRLVKEDLGKLPHGSTTLFHEDLDLPPQLHKVKKTDYAGSGFQRGHMCPDGDRDLDAKLQAQTFVMTNMVPQSGTLNGGSWGRLEEECRNFARADKELFIVAGPIGKGGTGKIENKAGPADDQIVTSDTLANGTITVPSHCWKVILVLERGDTPPAQRVTKDSQLIAVILANDLTPKKWDQHQVPVAEIERLTGFQFFQALPPDVREALVNRSVAPPVVMQPQPLPGPRLRPRLAPPRGFPLLRRLIGPRGG